MRIPNRLVEVLFVLGATLIPFSVLSQSSPTVYSHQVFWNKTELNEIFANNFGLGFDFVGRTKNELGSGSRFSTRNREGYRLWVHYQFSPYARFSLSPLGYKRTEDYLAKEEDYLRPTTHELRTTFQFFHHIKQSHWMHTWRYRYEWRWQFRENADPRFLQRIRIRYRVRYIFNSTNFYQDGIYYATVSNELGINFGQTVPYMFNQNRLYVGVGVRVLNAMRIELRYVNRFRSRAATGFEYDLSQGPMIGIYIDQVSGLGRKVAPSIRYYD